jgi:hypothetical protein
MEPMVTGHISVFKINVYFIDLSCTEALHCKHHIQSLFVQQKLPQNHLIILFFLNSTGISLQYLPDKTWYVTLHEVTLQLIFFNSFLQIYQQNGYVRWDRHGCQQRRSKLHVSRTVCIKKIKNKYKKLKGGN